MRLRYIPIAILASALVGYLVAHFRKGAYFSDHAMFIMVGIAAMAALGFLDDFLKVRRAHNRGVLWKKKGGTWQLYRDMWSGNAPPPKPEAAATTKATRAVRTQYRPSCGTSSARAAPNRRKSSSSRLPNSVPSAAMWTTSITG